MKVDFATLEISALNQNYLILSSEQEQSRLVDFQRSEQREKNIRGLELESNDKRRTMSIRKFGRRKHRQESI